MKKALEGIPYSLFPEVTHLEANLQMDINEYTKTT